MTKKCSECLLSGENRNFSGICHIALQEFLQLKMPRRPKIHRKGKRKGEGRQRTEKKRLAYLFFYILSTLEIVAQREKAKTHQNSKNSPNFCRYVLVSPVKSWDGNARNGQEMPRMPTFRWKQAFPGHLSHFPARICVMEMAQKA